MSTAARLLEVVRDAAERHEDLPAALRASGLPGAAIAADRLAAGATLPAAVAGLVPPRLALLLDGGIPPLATVAALLADEAWREHERRRIVADHIGYPIASLVLVIGLAVAIAVIMPRPVWTMRMPPIAWALLPALAAAMLAWAPHAPRRWHIPGSGWARHLDLASRWARAALAVRWRLTEADAQRLLGVDLEPLAAVLGTPGAEAHCRLLAGWHQARARRRMALTARLAAGLILATGGALVLASARLPDGAFW